MLRDIPDVWPDHILLTFARLRDYLGPNSVRIKRLGCDGSYLIRAAFLGGRWNGPDVERAASLDEAAAIGLRIARALGGPLMSAPAVTRHLH